MNYKSEKICRLCLNWTDYDVDILDETTKRVLDALSIQINLSISKEPLICKNCIETLRRSFDLVSTCQNTRDSITGFGFNRNLDCKLCLFCMQAVRDDSFNLNQLEEDIVSMKGALSEYIFQLYVSASEEPILCESCYSSLQMYINFSKICIDIENKIRTYYNLVDADVKMQVDLYDVLVFTLSHNKVDYTSLTALKTEEKPYKFEENLEDKTRIKTEDFIDGNDLPLHKDNLILYKTELESTQNGHAATSKEEKYNCSSCPYTTSTKRYLTKHLVRHKKSSEIPLVKCEFCPYETRHKWYLATHALLHKDSSEVEVFKCNYCPYQTKNIKNLKNHLVNHDDTLEYKCEKCPFVTKHKLSMRRHQITHKSTSEIAMYKCESCLYETRYKKNIVKHVLVHKDATEVKMYGCDVCPYETKNKHNLNLHKVVHKKVSELKIFKCEHCKYETKRSSNLKQHMIVHMSMAEVQVFKCGLCSYEAKRKTNLKQHMVGVHNRQR